MAAAAHELFVAGQAEGRGAESQPALFDLWSPKGGRELKPTPACGSRIAREENFHLACPPGRRLVCFTPCLRRSSSLRRVEPRVLLEFTPIAEMKPKTSRAVAAIASCTLCMHRELAVGLVDSALRLPGGFLGTPKRGFGAFSRELETLTTRPPSRISAKGSIG